MLDKLRREIRDEPIVLAHHPLCGRYDDHFFLISGRKVCRGCLTVYPSALLAFIVIRLLDYTDFWWLFGTALFLFCINFLRIAIDRSRLMNVLFNIMLGSILALTVQALLYCPSDLRIVFFPFTAIAAAIFMGLRGWRLVTKCKKCPDYASFPKCMRGK